jgi:hypothetical protein
MESRQANPGCTVVLVLLLAAAVLLYLFAAAAFSDSGSGDAAGRGMAQGFAALAMILLWIVLGLFMLAAFIRTTPSGGVVSTALFLTVGGAVASVHAIMMTYRPEWLAISIYGLAPLAAGFGLWMQGESRRAATASRASLVAFAVAGVAFMAPAAIAQWQWATGASQRAADMARAQAEYGQAQAEEERAYEARFRALGPQSPLDDYLDFLAGPFAGEALAGIRALPLRTADAARMLRDGSDLHRLERLHEFDLDAAGPLCDAYRARFDRQLAEANPARPGWRDVPGSLRQQMDNLRWLAGQDCDLSVQLRNLAAAEGMLPADWRLPGYAEEIEAITTRAGAAGVPGP